jgi:hypothetical protein
MSRACKSGRSFASAAIRLIESLPIPSRRAASSVVTPKGAIAPFARAPSLRHAPEPCPSPAILRPTSASSVVTPQRCYSPFGSASGHDQTLYRGFAGHAAARKRLTDFATSESDFLSEATSKFGLCLFPCWFAPRSPPCLRLAIFATTSVLILPSLRAAKASGDLSLTPFALATLARERPTDLAASESDFLSFRVSKFRLPVCWFSPFLMFAISAPTASHWEPFRLRRAKFLATTNEKAMSSSVWSDQDVILHFDRPNGHGKKRLL